MNVRKASLWLMFVLFRLLVAAFGYSEKQFAFAMPPFKHKPATFLPKESIKCAEGDINGETGWQCHLGLDCTIIVLFPTSGGCHSMFETGFKFL